MRKMLWGGAAAAVVVALGVGYLAVGYAHAHPCSWVGRCLVTAHLVAAPEVRAVRSAGHATEVAFRTAEGLLGNDGDGAACEEGDKCAAPETPAAGDGYLMPPAVLPGGVVMHEDDVLPSQPMPPVRDVVGALPFLGAVEEYEEVRMPAVEDDAPKMPRVSGDGDGFRPESRPAVMPGCDKDAAPRSVKGREVPARHPEVNTMEIRPSDLWFFDMRMPF